jgi:hypothetical protein
VLVSGTGTLLLKVVRASIEFKVIKNPTDKKYIGLTPTYHFNDGIAVTAVLESTSAFPETQTTY